MTSTMSTSQESTASASSLAEAARYALLRRLAPSMRHHLVVNLQPIGMIYEVMERRLRGPDPDLAGVHDSARKINGFARGALDSCLDVVTWLAPEEDTSISVVKGVNECLGLLATSLAFRGFALRHQIASMPRQVCRTAIRNVLTAAMLCASDETPAPAELVLTAEPGANALLLTLTVHPTEGERGFAAEIPYRRLNWSDVEALALAESVEMVRQGKYCLRLSISWADSRP